jgi:hypothetical protein
VVEADLQQRLGFHALYVELHLTEPNPDACIELNEMSSFREYREMRPEVVELELDLIDLDHRDVDVNVDRLVDLVGIDDRVIRQVLAGAPRA